MFKLLIIFSEISHCFVNLVQLRKSRSFVSSVPPPPPPMSDGIPVAQSFLIISVTDVITSKFVSDESDRQISRQNTSRLNEREKNRRRKDLSERSRLLLGNLLIPFIAHEWICVRGRSANVAVNLQFARLARRVARGNVDIGHLPPIHCGHPA